MAQSLGGTITCSTGTVETCYNEVIRACKITSLYPNFVVTTNVLSVIINLDEAHATTYTLPEM